MCALPIPKDLAGAADGGPGGKAPRRANPQRTQKTQQPESCVAGTSAPRELSRLQLRSEGLGYTWSPTEESEETRFGETCAIPILKDWPVPPTEFRAAKPPDAPTHDDPNNKATRELRRRDLCTKGAETAAATGRGTRI